MKVIGLTGGIGSGKSTVSRFLAERGAVIIDADRVGHEAFQSHTGLWREVVAAFGNDILKTNGEIDRAKLGKIVFGNPERLAQLNRIMHPRIHDMLKAQIENYRRQGAGVVVLEVPLLIEAGWTSLVDEVWVIAATETNVLRRLKERIGLSEAESLARIRSQLPAEERQKYADAVINNDSDLDELKKQVEELWHRLVLDT